MKDVKQILNEEWPNESFKDVNDIVSMLEENSESQLVIDYS